MRKLLILSLLFVAGCADWSAGKLGVGYNHKTGQASGELKGAKGNYNENTGLNLGFGDNTVPALIVAGVLGSAILASYPIQRGLRLRRERKWKEQQAQAAAYGYLPSSGYLPLGQVPTTVVATPLITSMGTPVISSATLPSKPSGTGSSNSTSSNPESSTPQPS